MRRFRSIRFAVVAAVMAGVLGLVPALPASATSNAHPNNSHPSTYLALGDSVPFGYNPLLVAPGVNPRVFVGYPQLAAHLFARKLTVFNASCPGETSTSLLSGTRPDNGCQDYRQFIGALHVAYSGSQLKYAETFLAAHPRTTLVSLMVGANDLFLLQDNCVATVPSAQVDACIVAGLPSLLRTLKANLTTIYRGLRNTGFKGEFVAVTYYSTNYADPFVTAAIGAVDTVLAGVTKSFGGDVANGFVAFGIKAAPFGGNTCRAGLLIHLTATTCDVHPSRTGATLLASALYAAQRR